MSCMKFIKRVNSKNSHHKDKKVIYFFNFVPT